MCVVTVVYMICNQAVCNVPDRAEESVRGDGEAAAD